MIWVERVNISLIIVKMIDIGKTGEVGPVVGFNLLVRLDSIAGICLDLGT